MWCKIEFRSDSAKNNKYKGCLTDQKDKLTAIINSHEDVKIDRGTRLKMFGKLISINNKFMFECTSMKDVLISPNEEKLADNILKKITRTPKRKRPDEVQSNILQGQKPSKARKVSFNIFKSRCSFLL